MTGDIDIVEDCGLPISDETERIDFALKFGQPRFLEKSL